MCSAYVLDGPPPKPVSRIVIVYLPSAGATTDANGSCRVIGQSSAVASGRRRGRGWPARCPSSRRRGGRPGPRPRGAGPSGAITPKRSTSPESITPATVLFKPMDCAVFCSSFGSVSATTGRFTRWMTFSSERPPGVRTRKACASGTGAGVGLERRADFVVGRRPRACVQVNPASYSSNSLASLSCPPARVTAKSVPDPADAGDDRLDARRGRDGRIAGRRARRRARPLRRCERGASVRVHGSIPAAARAVPPHSDGSAQQALDDLAIRDDRLRAVSGRHQVLASVDAEQVIDRVGVVLDAKRSSGGSPARASDEP